jgi:tetratricopeptide (TPR) repeat protein
MLQDLIKIKPQSKKNYYTSRYEFATAVKKPREKAKYYFQWAMIFHAKRKPAEAYKYYEKAILHHKRPVYLKQMAILHHEMGYLKEALAYIRIAVDIEKQEQRAKERRVKALQEKNFSTVMPFTYITSYSQSSQSFAALTKNTTTISSGHYLGKYLDPPV